MSKHVALFCISLHLQVKVAMGKCVFNRKWLSDEKFSWVKEFKGDKHKALCCVCNKVIDIERMGESALKSHMKGKKHKRNTCTGATSSSTQVMSAFFHKPVRSDSNSFHADGSNGEFSVPPPPPAEDGQSTVQLTEGCQQQGGTLENFVTKNDVLSAEILWTLQTISAHYSYKSNEKVGKIFQVMFPDSAIASRFACGEKKTAYLCAFGLAKHFKELLIDEVKGAFTILFDESLNRKSQQKQMDIHVRFWVGNQVNTRYLGSQFMGRHHFSILQNNINLRM